uniref:Uncharacterized protein n=1 Tax=Graphocephala atropunctata TaxID=36148 RepID=A0A1B6LHR1_9HEMI
MLVVTVIRLMTVVVVTIVTTMMLPPPPVPATVISAVVTPIVVPPSVIVPRVHYWRIGRDQHFGVIRIVLCVPVTKVSLTLGQKLLLLNGQFRSHLSQSPHSYCLRYNQ